MTVPQLAGVIAFYVVVEAITMVSWVFNYVYVISNGTGGPGDATQVAELYIYQSAFQYSAPDLAAAAAVMLFGARSPSSSFFSASTPCWVYRRR